MGCCGQGRGAVRRAMMAAPAKPVSVAADKTERRVLLHYQAATPIAVRGVATGRLYQFDAEHATQHVAELDAVALLRSRFFVRED